ncbi:alpha/beta hydrolase [Sporolactobacillus vineae]|uniref:alpha/beta hydrolase n=1 Tax=Sporolactobacillus vineae TaxID=444463 RepID=UPI000287C1B4|nr:alpha/beta hydrolase [Sporolactobacillus vineae]
MMKETSTITTVNELDVSFEKTLKRFDDHSKGCLDPAETDILQQKMNNRRQTLNSAADSLIWERNRKDKYSTDLTKSVIDEKAILLDFPDYKLIGYLFRPQKDKRAPMILFVHGGGFVAGKISFYRNQCRLLAEASQQKVLFVEYRLAPENVFPAQIEDIVNATNYVLANADVFHVSKSKVVLVGDSAGGNMINSVVLKLTKEKIALVVELYSVTDIDIIGNHTYAWDYSMYPVIDQQKKMVIDRLNRFKSGTNQLISYYLGGRSEFTKYPQVSINYAADEQLRLFPGTLLIEAEYDYYRVAMDIFAARLSMNNVDLSVIEYCGVDHGFIDQLGRLPQAEDALITIGHAISELSPD